ncbi:MAG: M48 family metalloprotease [Sandaracinaceae bacterium]|nr:M48 family metalloprotease [Sandaracinaceae bacterium]
MASPNVLRASALASLLLASACGDLLGGDDPPPPPDPALQPPVQTQPEPQPEPTPAPSGPAQPGGFSFPGLDGIPLPIPLPDANARDPEPPARGSLGAPAPGTWDASGHMTRPFLEQRAEEIHQALVAALDAHENEQTRTIPFEVVSEAREPNAAAGCTRSTRSPVMMITSAMLELAAGIAETKAYDEVAGTSTYEQYVTTVVEQVRGQRTVEGPSPSLHSAPHSTDPHKLARQVHLFDQQVAFIVGHELAHHYRGHTNCVGGRTEAEVQRDELAQILAHTVPPFSQPREVEADMWGVTNVLEAGRNRQGGTWTQEGALINLDFFRRLSDQGGAELVLAFLSTHPPALIRIPIVRSTGQQWQPGWRPPAMPVPGQGGQGGIELPTPGGPFRLPDPGQLPIDPSRFPFPIPQPRQQ